jgi:membrane-bound ClpP family serine protease
VTGTAGMLNEVGRALTPITAGGLGRVQTHGEIWSATADQEIAEGAPVRVIGMDGLTLTVAAVQAPTRSADSSQETR